MDRLAEEIFRGFLQSQGPLVYVASVPAVLDERDRVIVPEVPTSYRERTDAEFDALVRQAVRASLACRRENARHAAANPVPRPAPAQPPLPRSTADLARAFVAAFRNLR